MQLKVKRIDKRAKIPVYQTAGSSGFDLCSMEERIVQPLSHVFIRLGLSFEIPEGYELQVRGRSGLARKKGVLVHTGTVDSDYRGEIGCILFNLGTQNFPIRFGDRICQGVIAPVEQVEFTEEDELNETERNNSGFGSTGI